MDSYTPSAQSENESRDWGCGWLAWHCYVSGPGCPWGLLPLLPPLSVPPPPLVSMYISSQLSKKWLWISLAVGKTDNRKQQILKQISKHIDLG